MKQKTYVDEFDSLRAVAAFAVMAAHFVGSKSYLISRLGWPGVVLFFCLSGYLITGILLQCRELSNHQPIAETLRRFYIRRSLRIFPLYYLAFAAFAIVFPGIRENAIWFLLYAVNIGKTIDPHGWFPLHHFWTLAVEEQFYLVWPFVILFSPSRWHLRACVLMIVSAVLFRISLLYMDAPMTAVQQLTPCCLDALGFGSLFAIAGRNQIVPRWSSRLFLIGVPVSLFAFLFADDWWWFLVGSFVFSLAFAPALHMVASNSGSRVLSVLRFKPALFLGRISYGLYVWHLPVLWLFGPLSIKTLELFPSPFGGLARVAMLVALTVLAATISWFLFEKPINSFKSRFPYKVRGQKVGLG